MNLPATANPDIHVLEQLFAVARRRWKIVALLTIIGAVLGFIYAQSQVPVYSSAATIMVRSGPAADPVRQGIETTTPEEEGQFLSQLELARSTSVATIVANRLDLVEDADFAKPASSGLRQLVARIGARLGMKIPPTDEAAGKLDLDQVVSALQANVKASRVGRTYVAAISYTHPNPAVARKVAQAFAEAFKQKIAQDNDMANSRMRAALQSEIDRAAGPAKDALQAKLQDLMIARALPGMDVVVMSDARLPGAPIAPRVSFLVAVGAILGAVIGCAIAGFRELTDRGVRDGDVLARALGIRFLGYLPRGGARNLGSMTMGKGAPLPEPARRSVLESYSVFGETIRSAAVALIGRQNDGQGTVTGVTSALAGDGATIIAANLATHLANQGRSVLLIDGNARDPRLSDWLAAEAEQGLVDSVLQNKSTDETLLYDSRSNISLLPMVLKDRTVEPASLFNSDRAKTFMSELRGQYQHIIIDLAPLSTASDARAAEPVIDNFVLAAQWGRATPQLIADLLDGEPEVRAKLAGLILTRADLKKLPLYAAAGSRASFNKRIAKG
ncbi:Wzz/FepE/Etk N-terminal domain-containing protein [Rhizobium sp. LjRoot254]|uniref:Wzz/FepE/Etk N-terminal domain-containing protein n=1 Tax=Rhizobium sp. LjRoot254 TaxID=3342297 RepID=UPI003ED10EBE